MPPMTDKHMDDSKQPRPNASEYGDVLGDVLKDQVRRKAMQDTASTNPKRTRLPAWLPPVLALVSIWLWVFPPAVLRPEPPTIPAANQEAGLRMEMFIQANNILRYRTENGRLPSALEEAGDSSPALQYEPLTASVFRLRGQSGDIAVSYTSTEPLADLLADAKDIVSGISFPDSDGRPSA